MPRSLRLCLFASLLPLLAACGGADEGRPARPAPAVTQAVDECALGEQRLDDGWQFQSVVDFERPAGNQASKWQATCSEVTCGFYFNYDSSLSPAHGTPCAAELGVEVELEQPLGTPVILPAAEPRCGSSEGSYHLVAKNIATCVSPKTGRQGWGATLAITFNANKNDSAMADPPIDASDWDGIAFWARRGEEPSKAAFLASARDLYSSGQGDNCSVDAGAADANKCDPFGLAVLLEPQWRFVTVPFSLMQQKGFGVPSPLGALDTTQIVALELGFSSGDWDVWVDDLAFYREPR